MRQHISEYMNLETLHSYLQSEYNMASTEEYCDYMARDKSWGDHITLAALAEMLQIRISVLTSLPAVDPVTIIEPQQTTADGARRIIYLSHWAEQHYNSLQRRQ